MAVNAQRLAAAARELLKPQMFDEAALTGWLYTVLIDDQFIDTTIQRIPRINETNVDSGELDGDGEYGQLIQRLLSQCNTASVFQSLLDLTKVRCKGTVCDNFYGQSASLADAMEFTFRQQALNVLIVGAGCTGLAVANGLRAALGDAVNVLVLENRIQIPHVKRTYGRQWATMIPQAAVLGLVDKRIIELSSLIGADGYLGFPINVLETLMLLSAKNAGVRFYFNRNVALDVVQSSHADVVIDASGGRLRNDQEDCIWDEGPTFTKRNVRCYGAGYKRFGVMKEITRNRIDVNTIKSNGVIRPAIAEFPIKVPCIKISQVPIKAYQNLIKTNLNPAFRNRMYIWPARLKDDINSILLIVNLTKEEYYRHCKLVTGRQSLGSLIESMGPATECDAVEALLLAIHRDCGNTATPMVETPFLFEPYLIPYREREQFQGRFLIRIGDSIFNGNPKTGNGLSTHLRHIRTVLQVIKTSL